MGRFSDLTKTKAVTPTLQPEQDFAGIAKIAQNWLEDPDLAKQVQAPEEKPQGRFSDLTQGRRVSFGGTGYTGTWPTEGEQEIKAWSPDLKEKIKFQLSGTLEKMPGYEGGKRLGRLGLHYLSSAVSGLGLYLPDVVTSKISESDTLSEAVNKITGFEPTPREMSAAEMVKFATSLRQVGKLIGVGVSKIPARQALKAILGGGLTFGARGATEEFAKKISTGKPVNWKGVHFEGGVGVLFGAGEVGLQKLVSFLRGVETFDQSVSASEHAVRARTQARAEINKALNLKKQGNPAEWERVMRKYAGFGTAAEAKPAPIPAEQVKVKGFGKYPLARVSPTFKTAPTMPVPVVQRGVGLRTPLEPTKIAPEAPRPPLERGKVITEQGRRVYVPRRGALEELSKPVTGLEQIAEAKRGFPPQPEIITEQEKGVVEGKPLVEKPAPTADEEKEALISQTPNINAPYTKSTLNRLAGDIKSISNFGKSLSTGNKRLSDFDIPTQTSMMRSMLASLHQPEIRNSIISPDTVDVVNNLIKIKFPTKISLHDKSMNKEPFLVNADGSISLRIDTADSLMKDIASATTKLKLRTFKSIRNSLDNLATSGTLDILSLPYEQTTTPVGAESASIALENRRAAMNKPATISTKAISHIVNIPQGKVESNINVLGEYKKSQEALAAMPQAKEKPAEGAREKEIVKVPTETLPSSQANAYEVPASVENEVNEQIKEIKKAAVVRPGFARIPSLAEFQELSSRMKTAFAKLNEPERDIITDVFGAIEKWRAETNKAGMYADWAKMTLKKVPATSKQLEIVDRYLDNPAKYQEQFDQLPDQVKEAGNALKADYEEMKNLAKKEGILQSWVEDYTPHLYKDSQTRLMRTLYPQGGKLGKRFRFGKQRVFKTMDEAESAGLHPITDPILKNAVYKYQLYKTIANRNLIELLKNMEREDGMPLIMGRPRKPEKLKVWENEYQWVNVPGLQRFLYVGEAAEKPMLISMPAKADPEVAKILNDAFSPWVSRGQLTRGYMSIRGRIKRLIMYNPLIHSWNIWSDVFDEVNFNPYKLISVQKRGKVLYKSKDELAERAVSAGLQLQSGYGIAQELRKAMGESATWKEIFKPLNKLEEWSDEHLWQGTVRNAQLGLFEFLTKRIAKEQPKWIQDQVDKVAAHYINTLLGTLPHTWFTKFQREAGSIVFFARNWTFSNIDMVVKAATYGKKGLGMKSLPREEQKRIGKDFTKHLLKGIFGLLFFSNLAQLGFLTATNALKKRKTIKGKPEPLHLTFQNEKGHWYDVDTGLDNNKGQRIYVVAPFFRYIRDYIGWTTEPGKTLYNKLEPMLKHSFEVLFNYSAWQHKQISRKGTPPLEAIKERASYFIKGITPSSVWAGRPGYVPTWPEWVMPFTGTWIRRGAPGGKFTQMMWDFRAELGYEKEKTDQEIDELLQKGDFKSAVETMIKTQRYTTSQGASDRIMQFVVPLNYYWKTMPKSEKLKFMDHLKKEGYTLKDLMEALEKERIEIVGRED